MDDPTIQESAGPSLATAQRNKYAENDDPTIQESAGPSLATAQRNKYAENDDPTIQESAGPSLATAQRNKYAENAPSACKQDPPIHESTQPNVTTTKRSKATKKVPSACKQDPLVHERAQPSIRIRTRSTATKKDSTILEGVGPSISTTKESKDIEEVQSACMQDLLVHERVQPNVTARTRSAAAKKVTFEDSNILDSDGPSTAMTKKSNTIEEVLSACMQDLPIHKISQPNVTTRTRSMKTKKVTFKDSTILESAGTSIATTKEIKAKREVAMAKEIKATKEVQVEATGMKKVQQEFETTKDMLPSKKFGDMQLPSFVFECWDRSPCMQSPPIHESTQPFTFTKIRNQDPIVDGHDVPWEKTVDSWIGRKKLPTRSGREMHNASTSTPIDISSPSPSKMDNSLQLTFEIFTTHVNVKVRGEERLDDTSKSIARSRLASGASIEFLSGRTLNFVQVDQDVLSALIMDEASTKTMNLFGMWMENKLATPILEKIVVLDSLWFSMSQDLVGNFLDHYFKRLSISNMELCFFPIICRKHWSLFVLYINKKKKKVPCLQGKKNYLLYMDSLGLTDPKECLEQVYRAIKCLTPYVDDPGIQASLSNPATELEMKILHVPQQSNGTDCGFYVMAYMRFLIDGILQGGPTKKWLTKEWFRHEDVCTLRMELHQWCMQCLEQV